MKRKEAAIIAASGVLSCFLLWKCFGLLFPRKLDADISQCVEAIQSLDGQTLYSLQGEREKVLGGWTKESTAEVVRRLIEPRISGCKFSEAERDLAAVEAGERKGRQVGLYEVECDGHRLPIKVSIVAAGLPGHSISVENFLKEAWRVSYYRSHPAVSPSGQANREAKRIGLKTDYSTLKSLGIAGSYDEQADRLISLEEVLRQLGT